MSFLYSTASRYILPIFLLYFALHSPASIFYSFFAIFKTMIYIMLYSCRYYIAIYLRYITNYILSTSQDAQYMHKTVHHWYIGVHSYLYSASCGHVCCPNLLLTYFRCVSCWLAFFLGLAFFLVHVGENRAQIA